MCDEDTVDFLDDEEYKYSIIVPVYNVEAYLPKCVESILKQTVQNYEVILVDDGSTDTSGKICDDYARNAGDVAIKVYHHQENKGLSEARNTAFCHARGKYLYLVDSDDWLEPTALEDFDNVLEKYGELDVIKGRFKIYYSETDSYEIYPYGIDNAWAIGKTGEEVFVESFKRNEPIALGICGLYRRKFVIEHALYFVPGLYAEDEEWNVRLYFYAKSVGGATTPGYIYRCGRPGSLMNTLNYKKITQLLSIYEGWYYFALGSHCSDEYRKTLLNEAGRRTWWALLSALRTLDDTQIKDFYQEIIKRKYLIINWKRFGRRARLMEYMFAMSCIHINLPFLIHSLYRKCKRIMK